MKTAILRLTKAISTRRRGIPGTGQWSRNLSPLRNSSDRSLRSSSLSLPRVRAILRLVFTSVESFMLSSPCLPTPVGLIVSHFLDKLFESTASEKVQLS